MVFIANSLFFISLLNISCIFLAHVSNLFMCAPNLIPKF